MIAPVFLVLVLAATRGSLEVQVMAPAGYTFPGVEVSVEPPRSPVRISDETGKAHFQTLPDGSYLVRATFPGLGTEEQQVCVSGDTALEMVLWADDSPCDMAVIASPIDPKTGRPTYPEEYVNRGSTFTFNVHYHHTPVRRATVRLVAASGRVVFSGRTDRKGQVHLPWIADGGYVLQVRKRGYFEQNLPIVASRCSQRNAISLEKACDDNIMRAGRARIH
jgi:hypothetical protein